jgi:hypothetical protein
LFSLGVAGVDAMPIAEEPLALAVAATALGVV